MKIVGYKEIKDVFGMISGVIPIYEDIIGPVIDVVKPVKKGKKNVDIPHS